MNPVKEEPRWRRTRRRVLAFVAGFVMTTGAVWANGLGVQDRQRAARIAPLDLASACVAREGPAAVAYFGGEVTPSEWRCARRVNEQWVTAPISPDEGCRLLFGPASEARPSAGGAPFSWECRR